MSLTDFFFNTFYDGKAITAKGDALSSQITAMDQVAYSPGGVSYNKIQDTRGTAAANRAYKDVLGDLGKMRASDAANASGANDNLGGEKTDITAVIRDLFILAAIGGVIWAFFKFGGVARLKAAGGKRKWVPYVAIGAVLLVAWLIYRQTKKTATDAGAAASNLTSDFKSVFSFN